MINFMGRAAGKLGTLSRGMAAVEEEASQRSPASKEPLVLPSSSEISPRATPGSAFSKVLHASGYQCRPPPSSRFQRCI